MFDWFFEAFYGIAGWLSQIVGWLYEFFEVFAGLKKVYYDGNEMYLLDFFMGNTAVSNLYWGMALVGIAMSFGFAIFSVTRKMFDGAGKHQHSMGGILTNLTKSIVIILSLSVIMSMVLNSTAALMKAVNDQFSRARGEPMEGVITYTDAQYASMARALNTIGNYSLNPSYNSRFNINKCFNEIRGELAYMRAQGIFDVSYTSIDETGTMITAVSWQDSLQKISQSANLYSDLPLNVYNESVSRSIEATMKQLRTNAAFLPLQDFTPYGGKADGVHLDRMLMLMGTMTAAWDENLNVNGSMHDALRAPYYVGQKDIYDPDVVWGDFSIYFTGFNYVLVYVAAYLLAKDLLSICMNCIARIFNMVVLYVIAPPIIAATSLDDGAKFKQWCVAFVVQCLSVFGTIIAMQLFILFLPIIVSSDLELFNAEQYGFMNLLAKLLLIYAFTHTAAKASGMITGILADNAGMQSIHAGDMSQASGSIMSAGKSIAGKVLGTAASPITGAIGGIKDELGARASGLKSRFGSAVVKPFLGERGSAKSRAAESKSREDSQRQKASIMASAIGGVMGGNKGGGGQGGGQDGGDGGGSENKPLPVNQNVKKNDSADPSPLPGNQNSKNDDSVNPLPQNPGGENSRVGTSKTTDDVPRRSGGLESTSGRPRSNSVGSMPGQVGGGEGEKPLPGNQNNKNNDAANPLPQNNDGEKSRVGTSKTTDGVPRRSGGLDSESTGRPRSNSVGSMPGQAGSGGGSNEMPNERMNHSGDNKPLPPNQNRP